ncbi:MAG: hypothetical protein PHR46_04150 [Candidatus Absconditabacteria bacterium]|nr:hypothetical protein [Candidatus Absconditabacteria bacterium]
MLNILSLQALRRKSTGPSKVAKNLIKGLDLIGEPYIINGDPDIYKNIYILDDEKAFRNINNFPKDTEIFAGPILHGKKDIPKEIGERYTFLYPSKRIKKLGDKYNWHKNSAIRPVGIDTYNYIPSNKEKNIVLIYFKTRNIKELKICIKTLENKGIKYEIINYDKGYQESDFITYLGSSKYVIWIGRQETQGIALEEVLSMGIPILLWDIKKVGERSPNTEYEKKSYEGEERNEEATAAEYFDESCGIRFWREEELKDHIETMENGKIIFSPRKYIIDNLSLEGQAKKMMALFSIPNRGNEIKRKRYYRNNFLLKIGFMILDNKYCSKISQLFINIYHKKNRIRQN